MVVCNFDMGRFDWYDNYKNIFDEKLLHFKKVLYRCGLFKMKVFRRIF